MTNDQGMTNDGSNRASTSCVLIRYLFILSSVVPLPSGCSGRPEGFVSVSGAFKFEDGTPLKGVRGYVKFYPLDPGNPDTDDSRLEGKLSEQIATGSLADDGQFELSTEQQGDGVKPGNYKIVLFVQNVEPGPPIVPERYTTYATPQWKVRDEPGVENHFEFPLKRE
jgi:hypothetical protein